MNQEIMNLFSPQVPAQVFDQIRISIASPEKIPSWSYGEIKSRRPSTTAPSSPSVTAVRAHGRSDYERLCGKRRA